MSAVISECEQYRYRLERDGFGEGTTVVIMVNPSTADAETDDATIRKLKGFGARNGWGRIIVGNLFAYRATDVKELAKVADPIGPLNDSHLVQMVGEADRLVFAWGSRNKLPKNLRERWQAVVALCENHPAIKPMTIGPCTLDGDPKHPLMLGYSLPILPWVSDVEDKKSHFEIMMEMSNHP